MLRTSFYTKVKAWIDNTRSRHIASQKNGADYYNNHLAEKFRNLSNINDSWSHEELTSLDIKVRHKMINALRVPRLSGVEGSGLKFFTETVTEDARVRKFKEPWTLNWLKGLPNGSVLYDVGANIGVTALTATEDASKCITVVAIEPAPSNYNSLVRNIQLNQMADRVIALPIGLGSLSDISSLNLTSFDSGSALHTFGGVVKLPAKDCRQDEVIASHYTLRYRLDELIKKNGLRFPTHIKIDVDGTELEVLNGASSILSDKRCVAVQVESVDDNNDFKQINSIVEIMRLHSFIKIAEYPHNSDFPRVTDLQFARQ